MSSHPVTHCFHLENYDKKWAEEKTMTINIVGREWLVIVKRNKYNIRKRKNNGACELVEDKIADISSLPVVVSSVPLKDETNNDVQNNEGMHNDIRPNGDDYLSFHIVSLSSDSVLANISLIIYNSDNEERHEYLNSYALLEIESNCAFGCSHFMPYTALIDPSAGFLDANNSLKLGVTIELYASGRPRDTLFSLSEALNYLKNINIMIVEDSHFQRKIMCKSLNAANSWLVSSVASPFEVLDLLADTSTASDDSRDLRKVDVFIIDYNLDTNGLVTGVDLTAKLRENNINSVIIGCSSSISKYANKFIAAGANSAWPKPFPCAAEMVEYLYSAVTFCKSTMGDGSGAAYGPGAISIFDGQAKSKKSLQKPTIINPGFYDADCILVAKMGQRIPAHRLTLAACSEWFANKFLDLDREVTEELEEIVLDDDTHILLEIVRFSYTTTIRESAVKSYADVLLQVAVKYQFYSLIQILSAANQLF